MKNLTINSDIIPDKINSIYLDNKGFLNERIRNSGIKIKRNIKDAEYILINSVNTYDDLPDNILKITSQALYNYTAKIEISPELLDTLILYTKDIYMKNAYNNPSRDLLLNMIYNIKWNFDNRFYLYSILSYLNNSLFKYLTLSCYYHFYKSHKLTYISKNLVDGIIKKTQDSDFCKFNFELKKDDFERRMSSLLEEYFIKSYTSKNSKIGLLY